MANISHGFGRLILPSDEDMEWNSTNVTFSNARSTSTGSIYDLPEPRTRKCSYCGGISTNAERCQNCGGPAE